MAEDATRLRSQYGKEIRIFDTTNAVLKVKGIRFELYDVGSGTVLDTQNSDDLNPTSGGSNEWGVKLNFSPSVGPLEIYTSDPSHRYPGNTIRRLRDKMITASTLTFPKFRQRQGARRTAVFNDSHRGDCLGAIRSEMER